LEHVSGSMDAQTRLLHSIGRLVSRTAYIHLVLSDFHQGLQVSSYL
jgi:hypothetical protein